MKICKYYSYEKVGFRIKSSWTFCQIGGILEEMSSTLKVAHDYMIRKGGYVKRKWHFEGHDFDFETNICGCGTKNSQCLKRAFVSWNQEKKANWVIAHWCGVSQVVSDVKVRLRIQMPESDVHSYRKSYLLHSVEIGFYTIYGWLVSRRPGLHGMCLLSLSRPIIPRSCRLAVKLKCRIINGFNVHDA